MKKIGITGSQGAGKTTLANALAQRLKGSSRIGSIARLCPMPVMETSSVYGQTWIAATRVQKELEELNKEGKFLVCERTILDDYAYFCYLDKYYSNVLPNSNLIRVGNMTFTVSEYDELKHFNRSITESWLKTYDYVFYLEPLEFIVADGVRSINKDFQEKIDFIIRSELETMKRKSFKIPAASVEDRVTMVMKQLNYIKME